MTYTEQDNHKLPLFTLLLAIYHKGFPVSLNIIPGSHKKSKFMLMIFKQHESRLNLHKVFVSESHQELRDKLIAHWPELNKEIESDVRGVGKAISKDS